MDLTDNAVHDYLASELAVKQLSQIVTSKIKNCDNQSTIRSRDNPSKFTEIVG